MEHYVMKTEYNVVPGIKDHAINMYGEAQIKLRAYLAWALEEGEWSASCSGLFTSGKNFRIFSIRLILLRRLKKERRDREDVGKIMNAYNNIGMESSREETTWKS
jgi:hypothetical protein